MENGYFLKLLKNHENNKLCPYQCFGKLDYLTGFSGNLSFLGWFLVCILLESFIKFLVDPYYEPLSWFMITFQLFVVHNLILFLRTTIYLQDPMATNYLKSFVISTQH